MTGEQLLSRYLARNHCPQEMTMVNKAAVTGRERRWTELFPGVDVAGWLPFRAIRRLADGLAALNFSIRIKILASLVIVILMLGMTNALLMWQMMTYSRRYDAIINNIMTANSINGYIKPAIDTEMWNIVAGKTAFVDGRQYDIIADVDDKLRWMSDHAASDEARIKVEIIKRTMKTLTHYVDVMGAQMARKSRVAENEAVLENIRGVSAVVEEVVQEYVLFEVNQAAQQYQEMHAGLARWEVFYVALLAAAIGFSFAAAWTISRSIYIPIKRLHDVTTTITKDDLQVLVTRENADEIAELGISFNIMIGKIKELLDSKMKEQESLKKAELRALQAQINPHFLYNTLDTIIWMAEAQQTDQVVQLVSALSSFFRISLSKGKDWITIGEEIERTRSYLTIQKMRYRDILDYRIEVDDEVTNNTILKLILQPLVENALYHGIKNKRRGGMITVRARQQTDDEIVLEVEDNGIGFTSDKLAAVHAQIGENSDEIRLESGFGIDNVNKRIQLYYGRQYGLSIKSEFHVGTCVTLVIPAKSEAVVERQRTPIERNRPGVTVTTAVL
jgi:two-component system sensor histidine kinase YesM